jgi:hypothetical protein
MIFRRHISFLFRYVRTGLIFINFKLAFVVLHAQLIICIRYFPCKTIILPVVLYECETWSLTLREEHKLRVLRRIFGPKREEVTGGWRKLHNEDLHNLYSSPSIIRMI